MPAGASTSSASAGLASVYGSTSGQLNPGYSSGPGNTGFEAVSRPLDDALESNSALQLRSLIFVLSVLEITVWRLCRTKTMGYIDDWFCTFSILEVL